MCFSEIAQFLTPFAFLSDFLERMGENGNPPLFKEAGFPCNLRKYSHVLSDRTVS
jgi:hypothetical protein